MEEIKQETYTEAKDISIDELFSEDIHDVISHTPHWMVRYGVSLIGLIFLLLIFSSWFMHYPDKQIVPIRIIVNHKNGTFYGELSISRAFIGKISLDKPVEVQIENYPSAACRYLQGKVSHISPLSSADSSVVQIVFTDNLCWKSTKVNSFKQNLKGTVELINQKDRLFEKLFENSVSK